MKNNNIIKQKNSSIKVKLVVIGLIVAVFTIIGVTTFYIISNNNKSDSSNNNATCKNVKGTLCVIASDWTGWSEQQPEDKVYNYKIYNNYSFKIGEKKSFLVTNVSNDEIVISLPQGIIQKNIGGGINLMDKTQQSIIVKTNGDEVKVATQTMDAGTVFTFKYIK